MKKENKVAPEISKHFAELGKKSWESRKKALIEKAQKLSPVLSK